MSAAHQHDPWHEFRDLPALLTPDQVAEVLQLSIKAVYTRKERAQLPGVLQVSAKVWRVRKSILLRSLVPQGRPSTPSLEE